jgi:uncharacterized membrane protein
VDELVSAPSLLVLIWFVVAVSGLLLTRVAWARPRQSSRALLDEEFARGELSIEEYRRRRAIIERV